MRHRNAEHVWDSLLLLQHDPVTLMSLTKAHPRLTCTSRNLHGLVRRELHLGEFR